LRHCDVRLNAPTSSIGTPCLTNLSRFSSRCCIQRLLTAKRRIEKYGRWKNTDFYGLPFFDIAPLNTDIFTILSQTVRQSTQMHAS